MALTTTKFPYTGPLYGPRSKKPITRNRESVKGIKRGMIRLGYLKQDLGDETDDFGPALDTALRIYMKEEHDASYSFYGLGVWTAMRSAKLTQGPNKGQYAMDALACQYVREDNLKECYPHPVGAPGTYVGQGLHQTDGIPGNWAIDFMAPGETKVVAVVNGTVSKLSGHSPSYWYGPGIFGWSIYYDTPDGYRFFSTHYGERSVVLGQRVDCGQTIGEVGHWPGDEGRSHTHLGCSSVRGTADAQKKMLSISTAKRVDL
jgi:hypothetical protein